MAFEQKISIKGINEAIADLNKLGPAGEAASEKLRNALNKNDMGKGLEKLGESASTVFEKIGAGIGALTGTSFGEGGKIFDELASHAVTAGKALAGVFSSIRSGGSEAASGLRTAGHAAAEAGEAAATSTGGFAGVLGVIARFAAPVAGIAVAFGAAAVAIGTLTYTADKAGAEILDLQYAAGASSEDVQRMGAAADRASVPFKAMAELGSKVRSGLREASLAAEEVSEAWEVMKERASTAAESVKVAETDQAESAISSAERIRDAEREKADAAEESAQHRIDAARRAAAAEASEASEARSEARSEEDFKDRRDDLKERYQEGKISTKDYEKEKKRLARDERRAKEDQAARRQEREQQRAHELENQREQERKDREKEEKAAQKEADEKRKQSEEAEKSQKQVDRAHTQQDRIEANKDIFARETQDNGPALLRLFSGFKSLNDLGGEQAYKDAREKLRNLRGLDDSGQDAEVLAERQRYIAAHGHDQNITRFDNELTGNPATARRLSEHAGGIFEALTSPIDEVNKENRKNFFPSTEKLAAEGSGEEAIERAKTHMEDQLVHGIGGNVSRFFDWLRGKPGAEGEGGESGTEIKDRTESHQPTANHVASGLAPQSEQAAKAIGELKGKAEQAAPSLGEVRTKPESAEEPMGQLGPKARDAADAIVQLGQAAKTATEALAKCGCEGGDASEGGADGHAAGGLISGPGTSTSDSIPANLSHGEFVVNADAVSKVGVPFMHALNSGRGFATGGLVVAFESASGYHAEARRFASGGLADASGGGHPVTFVLDGKTFTGFSGGKSAVDQLGRHAVMQQVGAIGRRPSHAR